jgi:hypothetical protein
MSVGVVQKGGVGHSEDLERIIRIPPWSPPEEDRQFLRSTLTLPGATMSLRDVQLNALTAAMYAKGLFGAVGVGHGKTLIAALLPTVLDKRAVVLTTPTLVKQARQMTAEYRKHFLIRNDIEWVGYSKLSSASGQRLLHDLNPELVICDECHCLKSETAARTKRFLRFMHETGAMFAGLSGTITKRSIMDFAHLLELAVGDSTPLPIERQVLKEWAEALDVPKTGRPRPEGQLRRVFGSPAREGWQKKFAGTCGVVVTAGADEVDASLIFKYRKLTPRPELEELVQRLQTRWERPDGEQITDAMTLARVERELRLGGHHKWLWKLGVPDHAKLRWLNDRARWLKELRELMKVHGNRPGRDSPFLMERCVARNEYPTVYPIWETWQNTKRSVEAPESVWASLSLTPLEEIVEMVREPVCIWTDIVAVGSKIAQLGGWRYYGGGDDTLTKEDGSKTIVCSIQAHGTGRNLQCFSKAVVAGGGPTGLMWQQLIGRHHRQGQEADEVRFTILFPEELAAARADAKYIEQMTGEQQKLLLAQVEEEEEEP